MCRSFNHYEPPEHEQPALGLIRGGWKVCHSPSHWNTRNLNDKSLFVEKSKSSFSVCSRMKTFPFWLTLCRHHSERVGNEGIMDESLLFQVVNGNLFLCKVSRESCDWGELGLNRDQRLDCLHNAQVVEAFFAVDKMFPKSWWYSHAQGLSNLSSRKSIDSSKLRRLKINRIILLTLNHHIFIHLIKVSSAKQEQQIKILTINNFECLGRESKIMLAFPITDWFVFSSIFYDSAFIDPSLFTVFIGELGELYYQSFSPINNFFLFRNVPWIFNEPKWGDKRNTESEMADKGNESGNEGKRRAVSDKFPSAADCAKSSVTLAISRIFGTNILH